jgi:hypothetical protein
MATLVTGDDTLVPVTLKKNGATFAIAGTAAIKARLVSVDRKVTYSEEVLQSITEAGNDLANSLVVVRLAPADTVSITYQGKARLEIQVDDGGKTTWFVDVDIVRGNIA